MLYEPLCIQQGGQRRRGGGGAESPLAELPKFVVLGTYITDAIIIITPEARCGFTRLINEPHSGRELLKSEKQNSHPVWYRFLFY